MIEADVAFGEQLRDMRLSRDLTQEQVADLVGVTGATWSRWETGRSFPSPYHLHKLMEVFPSFRGGSLLIDQEKLDRRMRNAFRDERIAVERTLGGYVIQLLVDGSLRVQAGSSIVMITTQEEG